jgi:hypothetical protein
VGGMVGEECRLTQSSRDQREKLWTARVQSWLAFPVLEFSKQ